MDAGVDAGQSPTTSRRNPGRPTGDGQRHRHRSERPVVVHCRRGATRIKAGADERTGRRARNRTRREAYAGLNMTTRAIIPAIAAGLLLTVVSMRAQPAPVHGVEPQLYFSKLAHTPLDATPLVFRPRAKIALTLNLK